LGFVMSFVGDVDVLVQRQWKGGVFYLLHLSMPEDRVGPYIMYHVLVMQYFSQAHRTVCSRHITQSRKSRLRNVASCQSVC
jgi:hypothetical protein